MTHYRHGKSESSLPMFILLISTPCRASFQNSAMVISQSLTSVSQHLNAHHDFFASMSVFPLPEFPGKTQETLLHQLLRTKLEPSVEDWVTEGRKAALKSARHDENAGLSNDELLDLWSWAGMAANQEARKHTWGGNYTLEEREGGIKYVVTGLRRRLKEDPNDSSEEEDDEVSEDEPDGEEMEVIEDQSKRPEPRSNKNSEKQANTTVLDPLPVDDVFRFLMKGLLPTR